MLQGIFLSKGGDLPRKMPSRPDISCTRQISSRRSQITQAALHEISVLIQQHENLCRNRYHLFAHTVAHSFAPSTLAINDGPWRSRFRERVLRLFAGTIHFFYECAGGLIVASYSYFSTLDTGASYNIWYMCIRTCGLGVYIHEHRYIDTHAQPPPSVGMARQRGCCGKGMQIQKKKANACVLPPIRRVVCWAAAKKEFP